MDHHEEISGRWRHEGGEMLVFAMGENGRIVVGVSSCVYN